MSYIQNQIKYSSYYISERNFLQEIICVLGSGNNLDLKGHFNSHSWADFTITEEVLPLTNIYPYYSSFNYMRLAGCTNPGFKDAVQYLIDCILVTPDSVDDIRAWKDNIQCLEQLRDALPIEDEYSEEKAEASFKRDLDKSSETTGSRCNIPEAPNSVSKVYFFDVQWSDCPIFVYEEVRQIWIDYDLGNDYYIYKTQLDSELLESYPRVYSWLKHKGVKEDERVIIHWWW